jgi:hypothetical protein
MLATTTNQLAHQSTHQLAQQTAHHFGDRADELLIQARLHYLGSRLATATDHIVTHTDTTPPAPIATPAPMPADWLLVPAGIPADAELAGWCVALTSRARRGVLLGCADDSAQSRAADAIIASTHHADAAPPRPVPAACAPVEAHLRALGWQVARVPLLTLRERLVAGLRSVNDPCDPAHRWLSRSAALPELDPAKRPPISRWAVLAYRDPALVERLSGALPLRSPGSGDDSAEPLPLPESATEPLQAVVGEALAELARECEKRRTAARAWEARYVVTRSLLESAAASRAWRMLAPLRWLRRLLHGHAAHAEHLLAWQHLQAGHEPGQWLATGDDPQWLLPCWLPAGWLRLRLHLTGPANARSHIYADFGEGFSTGEALARFHWSLALRDDLYLYLPKPARALRFDPLDEPGSFHLHTFSVHALSGIESLVRAVWLKARLLWQHRCLWASLLRGGRLLLRGELSQAGAKLFQALPDSRRLTPAQADALAAYQVWQRRRALTDEVRRRHARTIASWPDPPIFTVIVLPRTGTNLPRLVESLRQQTYPHWQLLTPAQAFGPVSPTAPSTLPTECQCYPADTATAAMAAATRQRRRWRRIPRQRRRWSTPCCRRCAGSGWRWSRRTRRCRRRRSTSWPRLSGVIPAPP